MPNPGELFRKARTAVRERLPWPLVLEVTLPTKTWEDLIGYIQTQNHNWQVCSGENGALNSARSILREVGLNKIIKVDHEGSYLERSWRLVPRGRKNENAFIVPKHDPVEGITTVFLHQPTSKPEA